MLKFRQRGHSIAQSCVLDANNNSCSGECVRGREGGTSSRLRKTTVIVVDEELDERVDKWYRRKARGTNNFVGQAWIGRPPKRCHNQRTSGSNNSSITIRCTAVLAAVKHVNVYKRNRFILKQLIDIINWRTSLQRGASRNRNDAASLYTGNDRRDITRSRCNWFLEIQDTREYINQLYSSAGNVENR